MKNALAALLATSLLTAHTAELSAAVAEQPWVLLIPAGKFSGRDGRGPYDAGDKAKLVQIADLTRRYHGSTDILVDYEHQSINSQKNGQPAPAAGWIKEVEARDDGLYGRIEWTANASTAIKAREYRYLSPVYFHTKEGTVLALQNVALTNSPNLDMAEVSAHSIFSAATPNEVSMKRVLAALGLADGTSEDDALIAINSLLTSSTAIAVAAGLTNDAKSDAIAVAVQTVFADRKRIAIAAGQAENASTDQIVAAFSSAHTVDPTKFVPIAQVSAMQASITALQEKMAGGDAETAVGAAIKAGKLAPTLREWAITMHRTNPQAFEEFVGKAPVLTSAQRATALNPTADNPAAGLDDADIAVMRQMGLTAEDMQKSRQQMEAGR